ncbi:MAG: ParA family protein [Alphaproteobacteria bacterium]|nr:ParA family protein [Alphaproteobacteria bacterium]
MATIAVMNAKGGVGKSTLTMALAETLAIFHGKTVLLVDADGQMSLSLMVMPLEKQYELIAQQQTLVGLLSKHLDPTSQTDWRTFITSGVGDVDDAIGRLHILSGDINLPLIERQIISRHAEAEAYAVCSKLLNEAEQHVDFVIVDCAPGISLMTEIWLRECQWHLVPIKPDVLAVSGLKYLKAFQQQYPEATFATVIGTMINMKHKGFETDEMIHDVLFSDLELKCFKSCIPMIPHIQKATLFSRETRSYQNKYPGEAGQAIRSITAELIGRLGGDRGQHLR